VIVPGQKRDENQLATELADAVRRDPATGFLHRRAQLEAMRERLTVPASGGSRYVAQIRIDKFAAIEKEVGIDGSEQVLLEFAGLLRTQVMPKDIAGRFGGVSFLLLLERGNGRDAESWAEQLLERVRNHVFHVGAKSLSLTCSIGVGEVPNARPDLDAAMEDALDACRKARARGGAQVCMQEKLDADTRVQAYDQVWVKHIKAALMENRFRLVQQPIASLQGDDLRMVDLLIRMIDHQGKEVLPSDFMPAAERNDLLKNIDRWVVGASLAFAAQRKPGCMFVRLSRDSVLDATLPDWIGEQIKHTRVMPGRVCFQVTEEVATSYQSQTRKLAEELQERGLRFALERFGGGRSSSALLAALPLDFVKIDGAIVQGLATSPEMQNSVRTIVEGCGKRNIHTIAERVEDANTMAVLWQLGVQFVQGYFINEPEEVVM
jgi:diguanylate cyclase (GGDEF)-like protein